MTQKPEKRPTFQGQPLSDEQLEVLRAQIESFDSVDEIDPEIRAIIAERWPHLLAKLAPGRKQ